jgi:hypothetical protein
VCGRRQQLAFGEAALFEEAVQRGGGHAGIVLSGRQGQFAQQGGAGALGFSRLRRSMRPASGGVTARDWPRSCRVLGARASKPPVR